jgi:hypothetical protein
MIESLEALKKQDEDFNTWLAVAEALNSGRDGESEERRERERQSQIHRGKRVVDPNQQDDESAIRESHNTTVQSHTYKLYIIS